MVKSAYIHIPFCKSKCHYCSFVSFPKLNLIQEYLKALENQIISNYKNEELETIYIGGGTPSVLSVNQIDNILKLFKKNENTEITIELNPENLTLEYLKGLYEIGVNRLSIGCQTFDDNVLKQINRRHNSKQVIQAVKNIQEIGFENISLDFIYGLPNQTEEMFLSDLKNALNLGIKHISLYGLSIEKDCYFAKNLPKNLPDDDKQAQMYRSAVKHITDFGFEHYEFSNFSKQGYNSKHNLVYWNNQEYYGFGVSAHGYKENIRYSNTNILEEFLKTPNKFEIERIETEQDKLEEKIFLGLRKMSGINIKEINDVFNIDFDKKYKKIIDKYIKLKFLHKTEQGYALTVEGVLVSNIILSEFLA